MFIPIFHFLSRKPWTWPEIWPNALWTVFHLKILGYDSNESYFVSNIFCYRLNFHVRVKKARNSFSPVMRSKNKTTQCLRSLIFEADRSSFIAELKKVWFYRLKDWSRDRQNLKSERFWLTLSLLPWKLVTDSILEMFRIREPKLRKECYGCLVLSPIIFPLLRRHVPATVKILASFRILLHLITQTGTNSKNLPLRENKWNSLENSKKITNGKILLCIISNSLTM